MRRLALPLAVALTLAAPATPRAARDEAPLPSVERDWTEPPPGSAADRALWRALRDGTGFATLHLARLAQCAYRIRYGRYYEELDARGGEAKAIRAKLAAAATAAEEAVPVRPDAYRCRHVLLDLDQLLTVGDRASAAAGAAEVRADATACAEKMKSLVAAVAPAADGLEAALAATDAFLGRAAPQPPPGEKAPRPDQAGATLKEVSP